MRSSTLSGLTLAVALASAHAMSADVFVRMAPLRLLVERRAVAPGRRLCVDLWLPAVGRSCVRLGS